MSETPKPAPDGSSSTDDSVVIVSGVPPKDVEGRATVTPSPTASSRVAATSNLHQIESLTTSCDSAKSPSNEASGGTKRTISEVGGTAARAPSKAFVDLTNWIGGGEDSDSDGEIRQWRSSKKKARNSRRLGALPKLTETERNDILAKIKVPADRAMQRLLWDIDFRYTLKEHQFEAVRAVAGVIPNFPMSQNGTKFDTSEAALKSYMMEDVKTKGLLLADEMGLGKTVQSIAAVFLRNRWRKVQEKDGLPTLVIGPNDAVLKQWKETLIKAGVSPARVIYFNPRDDNKLEGSIFVLMTRYKLQTETKYLMSRVDMRKKNEHPKSPLFPNATKKLLNQMKNQYKASQGKARNEFRLEKENETDCVARLLALHANRTERTPRAFDSVVIDEVHFLKNTCAYWGIGAALLGLNSERVVALSGTPYNNGPQDMAAIMAFIDAGHAAAKKKWWEKATSGGTADSVVQAVSAWRDNYMLLRKKEVVLKNLPQKTVSSVTVSAYPSELSLYSHYEEGFLQLLDKFNLLTDDNSPDSILRKKDMFTFMMALLSNMRKVLIHPVMASGREITLLFSPSRKSLQSHQENKYRCVCCAAVKKKENNQGEATRRVRRGGRSDMDLDDEDLDDEDDEYDEDDDEKGKMIPLDDTICRAHEIGIRHFAHEKCIEVLHEDGRGCPACEGVECRLHLSQEAVFSEGKCEDKGAVSHRRYCKNISTFKAVPSGFTASAKIENVVRWFKTVPQNDKAIILSFFKGGLDLLEGIFTYDLGIDCARFDGDVSSRVRDAELDRFKESETCRVLLATVQSGGTGLNIVEANHVCFLDRWFNPMVHEQAQDRCHRIGQQKEVACAFHDVAMTVDEVMAHINDIKSTNASILLADGTELGARAAGLTYKDMSGMIGELVRAVRATRLCTAAEDYSKPLVALNQNFFAEVMQKLAGKAKGALDKDKVRETLLADPSETQSSEPSQDLDLKPSAIPKQTHVYKSFRTIETIDLASSSEDENPLLLDLKPTFKKKVKRELESEEEEKEKDETPAKKRAKGEQVSEETWSGQDGKPSGSQSSTSVASADITAVSTEISRESPVRTAHDVIEIEDDSQDVDRCDEAATQPTGDVTVLDVALNRESGGGKGALHATKGKGDHLTALPADDSNAQAVQKVYIDVANNSKTAGDVDSDSAPAKTSNEFQYDTDTDDLQNAVEALKALKGSSANIVSTLTQTEDKGEGYQKAHEDDSTKIDVVVEQKDKEGVQEDGAGATGRKSKNEVVKDPKMSTKENIEVDDDDEKGKSSDKRPVQKTKGKQQAAPKRKKADTKTHAKKAKSEPRAVTRSGLRNRRSLHAPKRFDS